ncbi:MAG: sugar ABC transporter permease [Chloroflexi bacterium]|nr:sugar ABC transporter permease [Chloroflexota bacterium]MBP8059554.1 sugar ABC transporter permease [Chloroflexota bacterium]
MYAQKTFMERLRTFLTFALIPLIAFTTVLLIPFLVGVMLTFTDWNGITPIDSFNYNWIGLDNFAKAFSSPEFLGVLWLTVRYVVLVIIFTNVIAFGLALLVSSQLPFRNIFRAAFFVPNLIGGIILGFVWQFIFATFVPYIGDTTGIELLKFSWLVETPKAFAALVIVSVWQLSGYMMLIYIAGLTGISDEILEASSIDGANGFSQLLYIKIPLLVNAFAISVFLTLRNSFMVFDVNLSLTDGGPFRSTEMMTLHIFNEAFVAQQFGTSQAKALVLFLIVAVVAVAQVLITNRLQERTS